MELTDQQQLKSLKEGDITVFEMFFRAYYQPLCNYAYTFVQDRDEAEEIVQSTFLSFWEKRENIEIRVSPKSYLYTMVRNACLNAIKHEKIKQRHAGEELAVAERSYESVSQRVITTELEDHIQRAIEQLPEQCRLIFKLSRFEDLKYSEIASQLNISIKTVENQMGKALKIMRERLKEYLPLIIVLIQGLI